MTNKSNLIDEIKVGQMAIIELRNGDRKTGKIERILELPANGVNNDVTDTLLIVNNEYEAYKVYIRQIKDIKLLDVVDSITLTPDKFCKVVGRLLADVETIGQTECEKDDVDVLVNVLSEFSASIATELFKGNGDDN